MAWEPMETAPADKMVKVGRWYVSLGDTVWHTSVGMPFKTRPGPWPWSKPRVEPCFEAEYYSHWQELPDPPK